MNNLKPEEKVCKMGAIEVVVYAVIILGTFTMLLWPTIKPFINQ